MNRRHIRQLQGLDDGGSLATDAATPQGLAATIAVWTALAARLEGALARVGTLQPLHAASTVPAADLPPTGEGTVDCKIGVAVAEPELPETDLGTVVGPGTMLQDWRNGDAESPLDDRQALPSESLRLQRPPHPTAVRSGVRRDLDFTSDSSRVVSLYAAALLARDVGPLCTSLRLQQDAALKRREIWIAASRDGRAGFMVIPNPARPDEDLGRHLEKLYDLIRQDTVPIGSWRLVTPAWVFKDRAQAVSFVPMSLDPTGDFLAGQLERSDARPRS